MNVLLSVGTTLGGLTVALMAASAPTHAANLVWGSSFDLDGANTENDCSGYFGSDVETCEIEGSPVLGQVNNPHRDNASWTLNGSFPSLSTGEWTFEPPPLPPLTQVEIETGIDRLILLRGQQGTWTYTRGEEDPAIRFWVAQGGTGFNLFYHVADAEDVAACSGVAAFSSACLSKAVTTSAGEWFTPLDTSNMGSSLLSKGEQTERGVPFALSHLTFYQGEDDDRGGDNPNAKVPEPATILGLGAIALASRFLRRNSDDV
ncbi:MAG: PEP-CTERM sorting domain-containing protein [Sodalinema sp.]|uniref:PEP-CTERM sorting domain-containing protein n=1 Tax=Sodalinema sp. TaxID=3080550 RepID=UPI00122611FF|nr:MAG: PEP-CTERM sorting domain-containing protein [Phormidium sp. SL48-SHIP]